MAQATKGAASPESNGNGGSKQGGLVIPATSPERMAAAAEDAPPSALGTDTILYLAYGSNLSAKTFSGMRKIRPISKFVATVPSLQLIFDLPFWPYNEPAMGNVEYRELLEKTPSGHVPANISRGSWGEGLIGVVYEITFEDHANLMRTEGGGAGYKPIVLPCYPLDVNGPSGARSRQKSPVMVRTLYWPLQPRRRGLSAFTNAKQRDDRHRPQPSARYLNLIKQGAAEHDFPADYQAWLASIQPYTVTTKGQRVAAATFHFGEKLMRFYVTQVTKVFRNKEGITPRWFHMGLMLIINFAWLLHDLVFSVLCGSGERTLDYGTIQKKSRLDGAAMEIVEEEDAWGKASR